jgi:hypothetical protein
MTIAFGNYYYKINKVKFQFCFILYLVLILTSCQKESNNNETPAPIVEKADILTSITKYNQFDSVSVSTKVSSVVLKSPTSSLVELVTYISLNSDLNLPKLDSSKIKSIGISGPYTINFGKLKSNTVYYITSYCISSDGARFIGNTVKLTTNDYLKSLQTGLVIYFPFDNDIVDKIGTIKSCLGYNYSFYKGHVGNGLYLNGNSSSYLEFADYYAMPKTYTISVWLKAGQDDNQPKVVHRPFFSKDLSFSYYATYSTASNPSSYPAFYGSDLKIWDYYDQSPVTRVPRAMYHFVYVNDGKNLWRYNEGELAGIYNLTLFTLNENSNKIKIGKSGKFSDLTFGGSSYPYGYFTGVIDELKVYNRALSSEEISMLYRIN